MRTLILMTVALAACNADHTSGPTAMRYDAARYTSAEIEGDADVVLDPDMDRGTADADCPGSGGVTFWSDDGVLVAVVDEPGCTIHIHDGVDVVKATDDVRIQTSGRTTLDVVQAHHVDIEVDGDGHLRVNDLEAQRASLESSGTSQIDLGDVRAGTLTLDHAGGADVRIDALDVDRWEVHQRGNSLVEATGWAHTVELDLRGSSVLDAVDVDAANVEGDVGGNAWARISVDRLGRVDVTGSGDLVLY
ncbi:MAG: DUF2807 domain-containing protein [Alphaproteobacteria bacterium]|nr:DUF2807 domain-containing protein [Alphaproteobacteria bacterium]